MAILKTNSKSKHNDKINSIESLSTVSTVNVYR